MVKKIKKYTKFVVCMALIMGLIAPSYAALSASDGSAFVTKAEFDSALADFNARLTTFEAGINSKIDSQVTSYLDRNGIWNGKLQTVKDIVDQTYGFIIGKTKHTTEYCYYIGGTVPPEAGINKGQSCWGVLLKGKSDDTYWNKNESISKNGTWIEKVNKSGLLFTSLKDLSIKNDDIRCRMFSISSKQIADDCFKGQYACKLSLLVGSELKWSKELRWTAQGAGVALQCPAMSDASILFFVSSGDKIDFTWEETWDKNNGATTYITSILCQNQNWDNTNDKLGSAGQKQTTRKFTIAAPLIY